VRQAADHWETLLAAIDMRTVYVDLDGTLLGPGGSLFSTTEGTPQAEASAALVALAGSGVDVVIVSGRTRQQIREVARLIGARAYLAEMGGLLVYQEGREELVVRNNGGLRGRAPASQVIHHSGATGFLLDAYPGRLEPHTPWAFMPRECSVLLRGLVDLEEARALLAGSGYGWLTLADNGVIPSDGGKRFPGLDVDSVRAYHLLPAGVSKGAAVAVDRARRALPAEACIAVGDSLSDTEMAPEVGAVFVVANGAAGMPEGFDLPNVYLLERSHGRGFADAVLPFVGRRQATGDPAGRASAGDPAGRASAGDPAGPG
jgi:hydroxymethylpyrimidine pyrophosphatase-like HAD family hydrolase